MPRYNLVYRPLDRKLAEQCVSYAQNFANIAAGYLLNEVNALPHVTLCQFNTEAEVLSPLWSLSANMLPAFISLSFEQLYVADYNDAFLWVGLSIRRVTALIHLQKKAAALLSGNGDRTILTPSDDGFFPHLTLARLTREQAIAAPVFSELRWLENFYGQAHDFYLSLGLSDENGVFLEEIFPTAATTIPPIPNLL